MRLLQNGKLGIGTTEPDKKLTINQSADDEGVRIYGYDDKNASYGDMQISSAGAFNFE